MHNKRMLARGVSLLLALGLVAIGCGEDKAEDTKTDSSTEAPSDTTDTKSDGVLAGMKGTTPLVDLGDEFKTRMKTIDPELSDFNYGAESYDAVIIVGLAIAEAKTDGAAYGDKVNGITRGGEKCTDFKGCMAIIEAGGDVDYDGASGPLEFSGNGEPTEASYGILQFGTMKDSAAGTKCEKTDECVDDSLTKFVKATAPESADVPQVPVSATREGDGEVTIGTLLPITGSLAFLGPPEFAGVKLAIEEINDAGGLLGKPVKYEEGDSGDTENKVAPQTVATLLSKNVDVIIGAASSSVSLSVVDTIVTAGVAMFSPANTSKKLSSYDDKGLYFRNAPSDILQGQVLADTIIADGMTSVYVLALNDDYGTGLAEDLQAGLESGGASVKGTKIYDPKAADYSAEVSEAKDSGADAIVLIGFDESSKILAKMKEQGLDLSTVYGVDGNMGNALAENFEAGK
ncbi:MAG TPA: branched-chain amino acid ABC transporter substrate-binding protein [Acidimicrobiaceae bacterium]|jgi:ABC-type branched-subunit amino acid transport system substrate-binding protein|nr:branched-chain amino acid ABC transporter substrate-binding protein [Acidimicrobiaceae bacterium]